jgi:hypothetical protein
VAPEHVGEHLGEHPVVVDDHDPRRSVVAVHRVPHRGSGPHPGHTVEARRDRGDDADAWA